jgi:outer membrane protein assembly factor BamA
MTKRASRAATIALFATAVGIALPARLFAQDLACDLGDREVRALEFSGNRSLPDDDLRIRVSTTPSDLRYRLFRFFGTRRCVGPAQLGRDVIGLTRYYRDRGFHRVQVDTTVQTLGGNAIKVTFRIDEGPPTILQSYDITGLAGLADSAEIIRRLRLAVGDRWDLGLYQTDQDSIVGRLRNSGYFHASVVPSFDRVDSTLSARASIQIIPGSQARFGDAVFEVDTLPDRGRQIIDDVVRRVMGIRPGQLYSDRAVIDAQRNLFQLGVYRHLEVAPDSALSSDTLVILRVILTEDYMKQLDGEFGYATLDCGRIRMQYTDRNIFGTARRLELTGQATKIGYGAPISNALSEDICTGLANLLGSTDLPEDSAFSRKLHYFSGATYRQPRLLGTRWVPTVSLYSERRGEFKAYLRSTQVGADLSATRDVADRASLRVGYSIEYGRTEAQDAALCALFNRCDRESRNVILDLATLGVASATFARIRTDNVVRPTRGTAIRAEVRTSASELLGTDSAFFFNKGTGDIAYYFPLTRQSVVALRLRGGTVLGRRLRLTDPTGLIPTQERLYAGGPTSVRGFQQNELGKVVYIARRANVDSLVIPATATEPTTFQYFVSSNPDSLASPDRTVPLGGNSLFVVNAELRVRLPFFLPDILQFTPFIDGGNVWTRTVGGRERLKWTPGLGVRAQTFIGPVQLNVGHNDYQREPGPIYFNPDVATLACASPVSTGNSIRYFRDGDGQLKQLDPTLECPAYSPPSRKSFWQKLTFTVSIGSDF